MSNYLKFDYTIYIYNRNWNKNESKKPINSYIVNYRIHQKIIKHLYLRQRKK